MKDQADRDVIKYKIRDRFERFVKGQVPDLAGFNAEHDGAEGDWLTLKMGLNPNGNNEPDFLGFEMKKFSANKTTFGDWSPDTSLYKKPSKLLERDDFLQLFGTPNPAKHNRYSWSGSVFPKVGKINFAGQKLSIEPAGDVVASYDYNEDQRPERLTVKKRFKECDHLELARWKKDSLQEKVESKFGVLGWFRCIKDKEGRYHNLQFGMPLSYLHFSDLFRDGSIYIDCGMYQGNPRPYMMWRASNQVWDALSEE